MVALTHYCYHLLPDTIRYDGIIYIKTLLRIEMSVGVSPNIITKFGEVKYPAQINIKFLNDESRRISLAKDCGTSIVQKKIADVIYEITGNKKIYLSKGSFVAEGVKPSVPSPDESFEHIPASEEQMKKKIRVN